MGKTEKVTVFIAGFAAVFLGLVMSANAYTYDRQPTGTQINNPVTVNASFTKTEAGIVNDNYVCLSAEGWAQNTYILSQNSVLVTGENITGAFTFDFPIGSEIEIIQVASSPNSDCNYDTWNEASLLLEGVFNGSVIFTVTESQTANIWGGSNGFWGSTTVSDVTETMTASVQTTGTNIWPMIKYMGIAMAFLFAYYLIYLINIQLTPSKKEEKKEKTVDIIYHSADDLEFKRNYGQELPKRKRGRPKKVL